MPSAASATFHPGLRGTEDSERERRPSGQAGPLPHRRGWERVLHPKPWTSVPPWLLTHTHAHTICGGQDLGLLSPSAVPAAPRPRPALLSSIPAHNRSESHELRCQLSVLSSTSSSHPERQESSCHQRTHKLELKLTERRPRVLGGCGVAWVSSGALTNSQTPCFLLNFSPAANCQCPFHHVPALGTHKESD